MGRFIHLLGVVGCTLALAAVVLLVLQPGQPEGDAGPAAHWVFDIGHVKGSEVLDLVGGLNGVLTGPVVFSDPTITPAIETRGLHEGVVVRKQIQPGEAFLPKEALSLVSWVRIDQGTRWGGIIGAFQHNGPFQKGFIIGFDEKYFTFGLSTKGSNNGKGRLTYLASKTAFQPGKWYHLAATYDGKLMKLYVNGQLESSSTEQSGPILYAPAPFIIGSYRDDDENFVLQGAIHEVLLYQRALGRQEVDKHFQSNQRLARFAPATPAHFIIAPYLQYATRTSITVMWETTLPGTSLVQYGVAGLEHKKEGPADVTVHEVTLTGLKPNTAHVYKVSTTFADGRTLDSELLTFQTAVDADSAFSFILIGDTQKNPVMTGKIAELAWRRRPNFVVHLGDVVDNGPDKKEWVEELFRPCRNLFARVAVFPTIGNHERNHAFYYRYFSLPEPEYYYRYRYGNADFFSIDTNKKVGPGSEQYQWLDRELARSDATWKFVYHHHPAYSSDENDWGDTWKGQKSSQGDPNVRQLVKLYEKHNVDIVFNGHIHLYERTWPIRGGKVDRKKGVIYLTSGGGGGSLENFAPVPTWFKAECRSDFHFCHISIHGGRLSCRAIDQRDVLFDVFDVEK